MIRNKLYFLPLFIFIFSCHPKRACLLESDLDKLKALKGIPIPKKIHQTWIGSSTPPNYFNIYLESFKKFAPDYEYKLWTNEDLTEKNFPFTYKYILKIVKAGIEKYGRNEKNWKGCPSKKLSEISDLMRFEIIYHHGGFYYDVKGELLKPFNLLTKGSDASFVVSNETPCGFECERHDGKYVSTGFFGSVPNSPILQTILTKESLDKIDPYDVEANIQTGPFYFGTAFSNRIRKDPKKYGVLMLKTKKIYPYLPWSTDYNKAEKDQCIKTDPKKFKIKAGQKITEFIHKKDTFYALTPCDKYPEAISMFHLELGGTWK